MTRVIGAVLGAIGGLAGYLILLVPQGQIFINSSLFEDGLLVYGLIALTLASLLGLPGDIYYLLTILTNQPGSSLSGVFYGISVGLLGLTIFGLALSSFLFLAGGGFFVLLYFVIAEALFLIPTGLQFAAASFFNEYQKLTV